jgi:hypothetical protein
MTYTPWWLLPGHEHHRCKADAPQRGTDERCHNKAVAEGLRETHLRQAGKYPPKPCPMCGHQP